MTNFMEGAGTHKMSYDLQHYRHILNAENPIVRLDHAKDSSGATVCTRAIAISTPTTNPADDVYWAVGAQVLLVEATDAEAAIVYNTGTRANPVWTATDTSITEADILALIGNLVHSHTSSAVATFTATAVAADPTTAVHDASAATNGTPLYVAVPRGQTVPGVFTSENANSATANIETAAGLEVPVVFNAVEEADIVVTDNDDAATLGNQVYLRPKGGPNRWGAIECELVSDSLSRAPAIFQTATPTDTAVVNYVQEIVEEQIPLATLRELSGGDIINAAGIGGLLAKDTTPILQTVNGGTDQCLTVNWAAGNTDAVFFQRGIPAAANLGKDMRIHIRAYMVKAGGAVVDNPIFTVSSYINKGDTKVDDVTLGVTGDAVEGEYYATIAASDLTGARTISCVITPGAHGTDALVVTKIELQYAKKMEDAIAVYFDEDAASTEARFLQTNLYGKDCFVRLASGRPWRFAYHATASATGVAVHFDDDAGATARFLFVSPTDSAGAATTGTQTGFFALDGIYLAPVYVNETTEAFVAATPSGLADTGIPVLTLRGNREFIVDFEEIAAQPRAYFDDNGATADERVLAVMVGAANIEVGTETTERPNWAPPVGTISVTPTVNNSAALIP